MAVLKSTGTHFIGDNIERFDEGDVILIGKDLPHMWLNDKSYFDQTSDILAEAVAVHFKKDFLGDKFLVAPENKRILELIDKARRGVKFVNIEGQIIEEIQNLLNLKPFKRMIRFIEILNNLANHENIKVLSSPSYLDTLLKTSNKRLDKIYEFVYNNFKENINSKDVAAFIGMNASAFSRYFKRIHRKTFTTYLNEIRVGYACKLLLESDVNITAIGYESGFNNLSNFNRQFKAITKLSPTKYIQFHTHSLD
ncbi:MAG: AraC family transcriptional regulator [Aurantibacter sp.]